MRLAFWRRDGDEAEAGDAAAKPVQAAIAKPLVSAQSSAQAGDIDLRALGEAIARKRRWIILPTLVAALLSVTSVNLITPRYQGNRVKEITLRRGWRDSRRPSLRFFCGGGWNLCPG